MEELNSFEELKQAMEYMRVSMAEVAKVQAEMYEKLLVARIRWIIGPYEMTYVLVDGEWKVA